MVNQVKIFVPDFYVWICFKPRSKKNTDTNSGDSFKICCVGVLGLEVLQNPTGQELIAANGQ